MEHYIKKIKIDSLRHLSNITISLKPENRQHLIITGKNGSGKTSLLTALQKNLRAINDGCMAAQALPEPYGTGVTAVFNDSKDLDRLYEQGEYITAFYPADRKMDILRARGVEDIRLEKSYDIDVGPGNLLHKYLVHLKTQQAYARNENDQASADRIQKWFERFVKAMRILLDDDSLVLEYDYKEYDFKIRKQGREPFGFSELSDGYSSVLHIVSDLILRMERNWLLGDGFSEYNLEGVVLIDELETHLHIELQKKILPFLTEFFPRIQFIVTTHSPYILNSLANAKAYDLENHMEIEDPSMYSSGGLAESYFGADEYADELKNIIDRYKTLADSTKPTDTERAERAKLRSYLKNIPGALAREAKDKFEEIEHGRL